MSEFSMERARMTAGRPVRESRCGGSPRHPHPEQKVQISDLGSCTPLVEGPEGEGMMGEGAPMLHRVRIALAALEEQP